MGNNVPRSAPLFRSEVGVTLVGGGQIGAEDLTIALSHAPRVVAVDGGAAASLAAGQMPDAVYGDMDSLPDATRAALPPERVHEIPEQESTDFDKALRHIAAPFVLAVGFTGRRVDHELAVYHGLVAYPGPPVIVLSAEDCILSIPRPIRFDLPVGTRVSLFPMAPVTASSVGLQWPLDGLSFGPMMRIGTSNAAAATSVRIAPNGPGLLLILPRAQLPALIDAAQSPQI